MNVYIINVRDLLWMCQQYLFKIRNRSATRDCSDDSGDLIRAWKNTADTIKISGSESLGYCRLPQQIPGPIKYVQFLHQRQQTVLQWVQYPSLINGHT